MTNPADANGIITVMSHGEIMEQGTHAELMSLNGTYARRQTAALLSNPAPSRQVPMQVLSLGLSRMGTASLREALNTLGYRTHHGFDVQDFPKTSRGWDRLAEVKWGKESQGRGGMIEKLDFDQLLGNYSAVTDAPGWMFWEELVEFYPEAKVILVQRDYDSWYKSLVPLIEGSFGWKGTLIRYIIDPILGYKTVSQVQKTWLGYFHASSPAEILNNSRSIYDEHYLAIRKTVPRSNLLEFKLEDGWEPLCTFLGKEVPRKEFPRINDGKALQDKMVEVTGTRVGELMDKVGLPLIVLIGVVIALWVGLNVR